ncbi:aspergillopepsin A precursor [Macrophomina phaseolina]|uniref:Aspergillopepsin A n=1 Tax=Macrophomina phaseolina TaxID=35725 RepID=A0ABQ8GIU0_9PEZI|nr:aspergillopepsin A precursor [Macrophomina phaseolina]
MHTSTAIIAALSAFSFSPAESKPIEGRAGQGFSLQEQVYGKRLKNGPIALGNLYKKIGVEMPSEVLDAFAVATESQAPANTASTTATPVNQFDTAYMIPITLGGSTVMVNLDTGSSDLWAFSNMQPSSQSTGHNLYAPNQANIMQGYSWSVSYLDGSTAGGLVYKDTVTLGGATFSNISIEAAQSASDAFVTASYDGMLGLAFDSLNTVTPVQQKTLFSSIMNQLPSKLFTAQLKHNAPGSYNFGYIDNTQYTGSITYSNVDTSNGWWQTSFQGYSIGSGSAVAQTFSGVVDTGTTLMVLPSNIVSDYYDGVVNATYSSDYAAWIYPCTATLPNFNLIVNGAVATVPGTMMTYGPIDYVGNCYGGLQQNDNINVAILGDIFIKSQFIVFDQGTTPPRVGFARQAGLSYS